MKTGNKPRKKAWLGTFMLSLSMITLLTGGWGKSKKAVPQFFSFGQVSAVQGTDYVVAPDGNDSNPGSETKPWLTIQKAANTLVSGDTVYIRAGIYEEQVIPQNSGSAGNTITYAAYPGETVTIDGNSGRHELYQGFGIEISKRRSKRE